MSEQPVASAKASVMVYDNVNKEWRPSVSNGLSKVHLYHHTVNNTFRIVGRNINDHEVVINSAIYKGLKYNPATPTFHQWRDTGVVYGLNFTNKEDAENFGIAMIRALEILGKSTSNHHRSSYQAPFNNYQMTGPGGVSLDEYAEYRGCIRVNNENGDRNASTPEYVQYASTTVNHSSHPTTPGSASSPSGYGHHRTSSAPPNSQPLTAAQPSQQPSYQVSPPPPPPPPPTGQLSRSITLPRQSQKSTPTPQPTTPVSLASALATAKLKKTQTKSGADAGNGDTKFPSMASMMDEMTRTLARRRAQAENQDRESIGSNDSGKAGDRSMGNNLSPSKNPGAESPQSQRSRGDSIGESDGRQFVDYGELERFKQDIMVEMKKEIGRMKSDIIEAIRMELNRR